MNNKIKNPFTGKLSANAQRVGDTTKTRQAFIKAQQLQPKPAAAKRPKDKFSNAKTTKHIGKFQANAKYKSGRRLAAGGPHKAPRLHRLETGTAPKGSARPPVVPPDDPTIINFLDKIIAKKEFHSGASIRRTAALHRKNAERQGAVKRTS